MGAKDGNASRLKKGVVGPFLMWKFPCLQGPVGLKLLCFWKEVGAEENKLIDTPDYLLFSTAYAVSCMCFGRFWLL